MYTSRLAALRERKRMQQPMLSYCCIRVLLLLLHMCPHTAIYLRPHTHQQARGPVHAHAAYAHASAEASPRSSQTTTEALRIPPLTHPPPPHRA
jgi:hypothetical protein